jgi:hypothetical protein
MRTPKSDEDAEHNGNIKSRFKHDKALGGIGVRVVLVYLWDLGGLTEP